MGLLLLAACVPRAGEADPVEDSPGSVDLALTMAPGVEVDSVSFEVKGNGIKPRSGVIDVTDPRATISFVMSLLPVGSGYTVSLSTTTRDKRTTCTGKAQFSVVADRTSAVRVDLDCGDVKAPPATGGVVVMANRCPTIGAITVSPTMVSPGGTINLLASAFDPDLGDTLSFRWSAGGGGVFADPHAANTVFRYNDMGNTTLKLTVSDGHCEKSKEVAVSCGRITGGAGPGAGGRGGFTGGSGAPVAKDAADTRAP